MSTSPFDDPCLRWRKSSHSGDNNADCVELARLLRGRVAVRDSKNPDGHKFGIEASSARGLFDEIRAGRFDR